MDGLLESCSNEFHFIDDFVYILYLYIFIGGLDNPWMDGLSDFSHVSLGLHVFILLVSDHYRYCVFDNSYLRSQSLAGICSIK